MNKDTTNYEWIDVNDASNEHKQRIKLLCSYRDRDRMHRENELRQRMIFRGYYPDIGLNDIYEKKHR